MSDLLRVSKGVTCPPIRSSTGFVLVVLEEITQPQFENRDRGGEVVISSGYGTSVTFHLTVPVKGNVKWCEQLFEERVPANNGLVHKC